MCHSPPPRFRFVTSLSTDRLSAEATSRAGHAMGRVYDFISNTTDGVYAVDRTQTIVLWNSAAAGILGYEPAEAIGKRCHAVLNGKDGSGDPVCRQGCSAIQAANNLDLPPSHEIQASTKSGTKIWLSVSFIVVPSRDHRLSVLVHLFREVDEQQKALRVLQELADVVGRLTQDTGSLPRLASAWPRSTARPALTPREREILGHLAAGMSTAAIAESLSISTRTVRNHVSNLLAKLGVHSRLEAVTFSIRKGLL